MSDAKCARVLLDAAERHLRALEVMRRPDEVSEEVFGFHVQQGAEKLLKAWLALLGNEYPSTHDLETLLDRVEERAEAVDEFRDLTDFTPFADQHRYKGLGAGAPPIDRNEAIRCSDALLQTVRRQLSESERT